MRDSKARELAFLQLKRRSLQAAENAGRLHVHACMVIADLTGCPCLQRADGCARALLLFGTAAMLPASGAMAMTLLFRAMAMMLPFRAMATNLSATPHTPRVVWALAGDVQGGEAAEWTHCMHGAGRHSWRSNALTQERTGVCGVHVRT
eukprot:359606-Chlamydomonas_euryale.AAC.4